MDFEPLNRVLYGQLTRHFGRVRVAKAGDAAQTIFAFNPQAQRDELQLVYGGEEYLVCCPLCNDTRFRLYLNHLFGRRNELGGRNTGLVNCYNENCYAKYEARMGLLNQLDIGGYRLADAPLRPGNPSGPRPAALPGLVLPLDQLPRGHRANRYLAERFINPERVGRFYEVGYCTESDHYYLARDRIIIPVRQAGKLMGWQARYIGEIDWKSEGAPPKYWTCPGMRRGQVLYNQDCASHYATGILVEGPMDVWATGPMAAATFGFPMTDDQIRLAVPTWRAKTSLVILFDPDLMQHERTQNKYEEMKRKFKMEMSNVAFVQLPEGRDPADFDRFYLRRYIEAEARKQNVPVSWERR